MKAAGVRGLAATLGLVAGGVGQAPFNASVLAAPAESSDRPAETWAAAAAAGSRSAVHVYVEVSGTTPFKIERPSSGMAVTPDLVVTHANLVAEAKDDDKTLWVVPADRAPERLPATLVAEDDETGLALLRLNAPLDRPLSPLTLATDPRPGAPVVVVGFHDGEDRVSFAGVLARAVGAVRFAGERELSRQRVWITDAAVQRRCHGAALLAADGALLGLCNADRVRPDRIEPTLAELKQPSFGFVIPTTEILRAFAEHLESAAVRPTRPASTAAKTVAAARQAIVAVRSHGAQVVDLGDADPGSQRRRPGVGSGVVIHARGLVITNRHLVADAERITVTWSDGRTVDAALLHDDRRTNSALLRLNLPTDERVAAIALGDDRKLRTGARLLALGNPEGHTLTVCAGVLSARRGPRLQTDARLGNHNGGGAVIGLDGRLVGMADAGVRDAVDLAFARRGDRAKVETSLNEAPGLALLLRVHATELSRWGIDGTDPGVAPIAAEETDPEDVVAVVERAGGAMLNVYVEVTTAARDLEDNPFATAAPKTAVEGLGSGVIIDRSGLALTNWHVVNAATAADGSTLADRAVRVALRDGRFFPVRVLSISREEDLALLQLELPDGAEVDAVELGCSTRRAVGDRAIAIGNPHGRTNTVTAGILAAKNQSIRVRGRWAKLPHLLETDAAINAGNSGGALLDIAGRLIGINSAGGSAFSVTGFAIAVDHVRHKLNTVLLTPEKLRSPYTGAALGDEDGRAYVLAVARFSPAARAGLRGGDVIRALDGKPMHWSVGCAMAMLGKTAGERLDFAITRDGEGISVPVRPWSAATWAVVRQTGLLIDELAAREDLDRVRAAAVACYRKVTGDATAAPTQLPETVLRIAELHPHLEDTGIDLRPDDLLLGVSLREQTSFGDAHSLLRLARTVELQQCCNEHGSYEGRDLPVWVYRDGEVKVVALRVKRLML